MSVKYHDITVAGTPEVATVVEAGNTKPVTSGAVKSALNAVDESIAIRVSGNKTTYASGAAIGQYVIVDGSAIVGITDGLYKAAKAIPYNTVIDSTYLMAASGGGLNDLKAAIGSIKPSAKNFISVGSASQCIVHVKNKTQNRLTIFVAKGSQNGSDASYEIIAIDAGFDENLTIYGAANAWTYPLFVYDPDKIEITY